MFFNLSNFTDVNHKYSMASFKMSSEIFYLTNFFIVFSHWLKRCVCVCWFCFCVFIFIFFPQCLALFFVFSSDCRWIRSQQSWVRIWSLYLWSLHGLCFNMSTQTRQDGVSVDKSHFSPHALYCSSMSQSSRSKP